MVQPLSDPEYNPFKGSTLNFDYILAVSENVPYRDYGIFYERTIIYGDVTFIGALTSGTINLINVEIIGTLIIDIGNGTIHLINSKASKIIALSGGIN